MATSCWKAALFPTRPVLFRGDSPVLEHRYLVGDALLQNRRERIWKTGFIVLHSAARRARIFLSRAGFGSALDGEKEIINRVMNDLVL